MNEYNAVYAQLGQINAAVEQFAQDPNYKQYINIIRIMQEGKRIEAELQNLLQTKTQLEQQAMAMQRMQQQQMMPQPQQVDMFNQPITQPRPQQFVPQPRQVQQPQPQQPKKPVKPQPKTNEQEVAETFKFSKEELGLDEMPEFEGLPEFEVENVGEKQ